MELDSNEANKEGSKVTNPIGRFAKMWYIEGGCYGGL
jgi:hypothetical protein